MGSRIFVIVSLFVCGCASATTKPPAEPTRDVAEVKVEEPVPLVAPDEAQTPRASTRLSEVKTIGEDGGGYTRRARSADTPAPAAAVVNANAGYPRGYGYGYRSMRVNPAPGTPGTSVGTTAGTPAVGGSWRPPPSYGPPTMR